MFFFAQELKVEFFFFLGKSFPFPPPGPTKKTRWAFGNSLFFYFTTREGETLISSLSLK